MDNCNQFTMRWMRILTLISNVSVKLSAIFLLWFTASLVFNSKFKDQFWIPTGNIYIAPERNVDAELSQKVNVEINLTTSTPRAHNSNKIKIMIMSSMPRSGSTLLGELLANYSKEVNYYFEPDQFLEKNKCLEDDTCTVKFFNDMMSCKEDEKFHKWFKNKKFFFQYYNAEGKLCYHSSDYKSCVDDIDLLDDCRNSNIILIKNIRTRLKIVREVLRDNEDVKVIHLVRDPRGSLSSIKSFKWNVSEEIRCKDLAEDLEAFYKLKETFPQRIINVSYELFSKEPLRETKRIFKFLFNIKDVPEMTKNFLKEHLSPKAEVTGVMSTTRNATNQYQAWRKKINKDYLKKIENISDCRESILKMNHNLFKRISKARDENFSLFAN